MSEVSLVSYHCACDKGCYQQESWIPSVSEALFVSLAPTLSLPGGARTRKGHTRPERRSEDIVKMHRCRAS